MNLEQMELDYERRWSDRRRVEHDLAQTNNAIYFLRGIFVGLGAAVVICVLAYVGWRLLHG